MSTSLGLYILLFAGSVVAAAISGAVGFGGALLLLPILTKLAGPEIGVPLLTVAQLVGNLSRALLGARSIAWRPALFFLAAAIPAALAGSYCFVALPKSLVTRAIGGAIVFFVVVKARYRVRFTMTSERLGMSGAVVGFLSGLVGSAGPLGAAAFLSLNLAPLAYIATEATTAAIMHAAKMVIYGRFVPLDAQAWRLAALLSVGMIFGSWIGKKTVERLSAERFRVVVGAMLVVLALQMLIFG